MAEDIPVSVVCAEPGRQTLRHLQVEPGCTAREAVDRSGVMTEHPGVSLAECRLGIHGREVPEHIMLQAGDRVEVLRPLPMDPRERRRMLARQGRTMGGKLAR